MLLKFSHTLEILKIICTLHISHCKWQQKLINSSRKEIQVKIIFIPPAFCSARWCDVGYWNDSWNPWYISLHLYFTDTTKVAEVNFPCCYAHSSAKPLPLRFRSSVLHLLRQTSSFERPEWLSLAQKIFLVGISETTNQEPRSKE